MARLDTVYEILGLIGSSVSMQKAYTGWPSFINVRVGQSDHPVAVHASLTSSHSRESWERRFQNPASRVPVVEPVGTLPLLVGLDKTGGRPVLIVVDGRSRVGRAARFSILFNRRISLEAAERGWSEQKTATGEKIYALWPRLFPVVVEMLDASVEILVDPISAATQASGLLEDNRDEAAERARRTVSALVRSAKFSMAVRDAYEHRCAMCRVGLGLVAGAHIMPVSAPGSPDEVWNGLALCHNHHAAFDNFGIWISPDYEVLLSPKLVELAKAQNESSRFLQQTNASLWVPKRADAKPKVAMLRQRYAYYEKEYEWASFRK